MLPQAIIAEKALNSKAVPYVIGGAVIIGIGAIALTYFKLYKPFMCKVGLADCNSKKINDIVKYKGFNPDYANTLKTTISVDRAKELAKKIKDAAKFWDDDEGGFYSVLEEAGSPHNLSLISRMFAAQKWGSLADHITKYMDEEKELKRIKTIIENYA